MTERTVTSPAGEQIIVWDDDDFLELAGIKRPDKTFDQVAMSTPQRIACLAALWQHGAITDSAGKATMMLAERATPLAGEPIDHPTAVLTAPSTRVCVERQCHGKRTLEVRLVALPERWLPLLEQASAEHVERVSAGHAKLNELLDTERHPAAATEVEPDLASVALAPPLSPPPVSNELVDAVATALLARVVEVVSNGALAAPNISKLEAELEAMSERLGTQVGYVDRLRRDLRTAADELTAVKVERDGLRSRLRETERNLRVATSADAQRIIDAEVHRQVDKMMRRAPAGTRDPVEAAR